MLRFRQFRWAIVGGLTWGLAVGAWWGFSVGLFATLFLWLGWLFAQQEAERAQRHGVITATGIERLPSEEVGYGALEHVRDVLQVLYARRLDRFDVEPLLHTTREQLIARLESAVTKMHDAARTIHKLEDSGDRAIYSRAAVAYTMLVGT